MDVDHVEALARTAYERFSALRTDALGATPWEELSEDEREANRDSARFAAVLLPALGLGVVEGSASTARRSLTDEEVDAGGRLEHLRWCRYTRARGREDHPDLVPWAELDERTRELDRVRVRDLPELLSGLGLSVVPVRRDT